MALRVPCEKEMVDTDSVLELAWDTLLKFVRLLRVLALFPKLFNVLSVIEKEWVAF